MQKSVERTRPPGGRNTLRQIKKHYALLVFLALPLIWLLVFKYEPMIGVQIAFRRFTAEGGIFGSEWVGMQNFIKFFQSYQFGRVLPNTIRVSIYSLLAGFPIPVILALALNAMPSAGYRKTVQTVIYLPHFISVVVIVGMILQVFNARTGIVGILYQRMTGLAATDILAKADAFPHLYVWSGVWQSMGWSTIIYTAALSGVDMALHESAQIDGASRFQRVLYVDFPVLLPTATIMLILNSGSIMSIGFEKVYLMQNQLNLSTSEVISTYTYKVGMAAGASDYSYSTAIDLFNSLVNLIMLTSVNFLSRRISETSLW